MKKYIVPVVATIAVAGVAITIAIVKSFYAVANYIELTPSRNNEDQEDVLDLLRRSSAI